MTFLTTTNYAVAAFRNKCPLKSHATYYTVQLIRRGGFSIYTPFIVYSFLIKNHLQYGSSEAR